MAIGLTAMFVSFVTLWALYMYEIVAHRRTRRMLDELLGADRQEDAGR
jgi:hypothetical protein